MVYSITTEGSKEAKALQSWYIYDFWSRCWSFQEVPLPSCAQSLVGASSDISRQRLSLSKAMLDELVMVMRQSQTLKFRDFQESFDVFQTHASYESLFTLILAFESTDMSVSLVRALSTDPLERLYAMMALVESSYSIVPDYCSTNINSTGFFQAPKPSSHATRPQHS